MTNHIAPTLRKFLFLLITSASGVLAQPTSNFQISPLTGNFPLPAVESKLPSCRGDIILNWDMCVGSFTFPNGNSYSGEWRNGQRNGVGKMRIIAKGKTSDGYIGSAIPSFYFGEFKNNMLNGQGVWIVDGGDRYEGEFVNNILVQASQSSIRNFGNDSEKFRKKCESYGLQFGSSDFAKCMIQLEQITANAAQSEADRLQRDREARMKAAQAEADRSQRDREARMKADAEESRQGLEAFRVMGEIAKPRWIPDQCPSMLNARPGQYPGCN